MYRLAKHLAFLGCLLLTACSPISIDIISAVASEDNHYRDDNSENDVKFNLLVNRAALLQAYQHETYLHVFFQGCRSKRHLIAIDPDVGEFRFNKFPAEIADTLNDSRHDLVALTGRLPKAIAYRSGVCVFISGGAEIGPRLTSNRVQLHTHRAAS